MINDNATYHYHNNYSKALEAVFHDLQKTSLSITSQLTWVAQYLT
jgi:hypothetical protein